MLVDITQDIRQGKYVANLSPICSKIFGRRIFVRLDNIILVGNIQYTIDNNNLKVIVYVNFNFRSKLKKDLASVNMIIKEYHYKENVDLILFMRRIREELFEREPQSREFKWSFVAKNLLA